MLYHANKDFEHRLSRLVRLPLMATSKVGAISKAQKAQKTFFWKKNLKFLIFFRKCRIVPKNVKGLY